MLLSNNTYTNSNGDTWSVPTLIQYCKDKNYPVFTMPLACCDLSLVPWKIKTLDDIIWHISRIKDCDLEHPIILDSYGIIADGYHRVCKAILEGKTDIKAVRIIDMPLPDGHEEVSTYGK